MNLRLDHDSPVPLYHQIAEAIAYRIATGRLAPGEALPPVRAAADRLGINLHTVRRAYAELSQAGLVQIDGARGTRVAQGAAASVSAKRATAAERFLQRVIREAREKHDLAPQELARLIADSAPPLSGLPSATFVECSESQCIDHVQEIEQRWRVSMQAWSLSSRGDPPAGVVVATYFHHQEIIARWPKRRGDLHFVAIHPDPQLREAVTSRAARSADRQALLCEFDEPKALNIAADVAALLDGTDWRVEPRVCKESSEVLRATDGRGLALFSPRAWSRLSDDERADPRAIKVRYVILPEELESLGFRLGWRARES